jgi:predicted metal-dependent hydrolase
VSLAGGRTGKRKAKYETRVATVFRQGSLAFLDMIRIHELAHFKEHDHNKAFYKLCLHMNSSYHQMEFDLRVYLTYKELVGDLY